MSSAELRVGSKGQVVSDFRSAPVGTVGQLYYVGSGFFSIQWFILIASAIRAVRS